MGSKAQTSSAAKGPAIVSLTELGLQNLAMQSGTNLRIFNQVVPDNSNSIAYDAATGYLTLQPGIYRVDGWSLTTFGWQLAPAQQAAVYSAPGYCFLWNVKADKVEILGSLQD